MLEIRADRPNRPSGLPLVPVVTILIALLAPPAGAHDAGVSQMRLQVVETRVEGDWEIHWDDALTLVGLPNWPDPEVAWRALQAHEDSLRRALATRVSIADRGTICPLLVLPAPMRRDLDKGTVTFGIAAECGVPPSELRLSYQVLFDIDPRHRAYFNVRDDRVTHVGVLKDAERSVSFRIHRFDLWNTIAEFTFEGMRHIWGGLDHVLFLLALLLPAPLVRTANGWSPRVGFWPTAREVFKVVTAFTLAHTLTLVLAHFRLIVLAPRWVESIIALSVFLAAWNNLRPFLPGRGWFLASTFGLIHGLGFASALGGLGLPHRARGLALGTFNVGVELGQLAIVAVALPVLFRASRSRIYPRAIMGVGSLLIAWVAVMWTLERALERPFLPW